MALQTLADGVRAREVIAAAKERARHRDQPHFRKVELTGRVLIPGTVLARVEDCLVCDMPLPTRNAKTIQYFHGPCRKHRVNMRKF
jgi:hypothetical protein